MSFVNSPITDLLIRIKNSYMARRRKIEGVGYSKFKVEILSLLKRYNFIENFELNKDENNSISIFLHEVRDPSEDIPVVKIFSKPSRRHYVGASEIKKVAGGRGIGIISTNKGVMASHEAYSSKLGGEYIAEIY